jgi:transcriptional regulator with XRE-family HTH domain
MEVGMTDALGELVRRVLTEAPFAMRQLAADSGLSYDVLRSWRSGRRRPSRASAARLAAGLQRRAEQLQTLSRQLREAAEGREDPVQDREILPQGRDAPPQGRDAPQQGRESSPPVGEQPAPGREERTA